MHNIHGQTGPSKAMFKKLLFQFTCGTKTEGREPKPLCSSSSIKNEQYLSHLNVRVAAKHWEGNQSHFHTHIKHGREPWQFEHICIGTTR